MKQEYSYVMHDVKFYIYSFILTKINLGIHMTGDGRIILEELWYSVELPEINYHHIIKYMN